MINPSANFCPQFIVHVLYTILEIEFSVKYIQKVFHISLPTNYKTLWFVSKSNSFNGKTIPLVTHLWYKYFEFWGNYRVLHSLYSSMKSCVSDLVTTVAVDRHNSTFQCSRLCNSSNLFLLHFNGLINLIITCSG